MLTSLDFEAAYFSGQALYGDDFGEDQIRRWFEQEEQGYYHLTRSYRRYVYSYHALNHFQAYRFLRGHYPVCLALGCARGEDVAPLSGRVDRYIAIEPAEQWWSPSIAGKPAEYRKPTVCGDIPLATGVVNLAVCLDVLHHIPNAGHVLAEMARVLAPGGILVLREPISTMGDWRLPRRGLTANERGFPPAWLDQRIARLGLRTLRRSYSNFPATVRLARLLCVEPAFNRTPLVRLDACLSWLTKWNQHYHRDTVFKKIAPGALNYLLEKD